MKNTLLSIKAQNLKVPYEIIVSDGASEDNTVGIAKKYANKIIIYRKRSPSIQRNRGAKYSKGEFLVFVDADTIILPDTIKEIINVLKRKDVVLASCAILPLEYKMKNHFFFWFYNQFSMLSLKTNEPQIPGVIMGLRRKDFFKVGGFDESKEIMEDYDLSKRIAKFGKVRITNSTCVLTSCRRIEKWSKAKNVKGLINYFAYLFTGKGVGKYEEVR